MFLEDWFEHAVLNEDASLNEAAPRKAKDLGINPDTPPDLNNPNNDDTQKLEYVNNVGKYVSSFNELKTILQNPLSNVTILYNVF